MFKTVLASCVICLGLGAATATATAAALDTREVQLRHALHDALWPADIVRAANDYLRDYPNGEGAAQAQAVLARAKATMSALSRNDVHLYRTAFQSAAGAGAVQQDLRNAALGDQEAVMRLAHLNQSGAAGEASNPNRYVGWLQLASVLGNERASYELALHFRKENQPVLAATYEARAEELGYKAPRSLDHVRK